METAIKNLMFDLASNREIFDAEQGRLISKEEANDKVREVCFSILGINEKSTDKQLKRALKSEKATALFEVLEELIEKQIEYGWDDNAFFQNFVEMRNVADGDRTDFWTDDEVLLTVSKVSGDHHDLTIQRLGAGTPYTIPMSTYGVKVGGDIRLFLTGRKDWSTLIDSVAKAYTKKIQEELYTEFMKAATSLPVTTGFVGTGALSSTTKGDFDDIISNVEMVNGVKAVIMGTKTALKKLNALAGNGTVTWVPDFQKEEIARTGILGSYEGTEMLEIPQKFEDNKLTSKLVSDKKIFIFPLVDYKPIKMVDGGEVTLEVSEIGATMDDMQTYEAQRKFGVGTIITRQFGEWTLP